MPSLSAGTGPQKHSPSTKWNPASSKQVPSPGDLEQYGCPCWRVRPFPEYVSQDCGGAGILQVAPATLFMKDREVIPTVLHAMKGQLLSACRACPVNVDCVLRIFVDDSKDTGRITASLYSCCYEEGHGKRSIINDGTLENSTDTYKVM